MVCSAAKANGIIHRTTTHRHNTLKSWRRGAGAFASIPRAWRAPLWWKHATISGMGLQKKLLHPSVIPPSTQLRHNILRNPINVDGQAYRQIYVPLITAGFCSMGSLLDFARYISLKWIFKFFHGGIPIL